MGYLESIFERIEKEFVSPTKNDIRDWLAGERKKSSYENIAVQLQEPFALREEAQREENFDNLKKLRRQAERTVVVDNKTIKLIDNKIGIISRKIDIQKDFDRIKNITDLDNAEKRLKNISDEIDVSDLEEQFKGIKLGITEQKKSNKVLSIEEDIQKAESVSDVQRVKSRVERLRAEVPDEEISDLISSLEIKEGSVRQERVDTQREKYEENLKSDDRRKRDNARRWLSEHPILD